jgi:hypothetical protein
MFRDIIHSVNLPGNTSDAKSQIKSTLFLWDHIYDRTIPEDNFFKLMDKAYGNNKDHRLLKKNKSTSAIIAKKNRKSSQVKPEIVTTQRERPKIEREFAELKMFHRLEKACYWKLAKMAIQFTMAAIVCHLKRMVKLLFHREISVPISG